MREIQVTRYQSNDGVLFDDPESALEHEARMSLEQLFCRDDAPTTEAERVADFIVKHRSEFIDILCNLAVDTIAEDTPAHRELVLHEAR